MALAKASVSLSERLMMCNANLCAFFGPIPGNFCSCSISRANGGVKIAFLLLNTTY